MKRLWRGFVFSGIFIFLGVLSQYLGIGKNPNSGGWGSVEHMLRSPLFWASALVFFLLAARKYSL